MTDIEAKATEPQAEAEGGGDAENAAHSRISQLAPGQGPTHYVGVGASAGGLEALDQLFARLPANTGMAFIVIQHLSPDYKSMMVELLSKRTEMPVRRAEEGMAVEPNTVYLIPPKRNLTIFHGRLLLRDQDHSRGINLPIDVFLRSLAEDQGDKAVAVILSGTGSDGVRGIRAIKEAGGMVMVQNEQTAKFDGMPRAAVQTGLVDFILPPDEMPTKLVGYARHPFTTKPDRPEALLSDEEELARIFAMLRERTRVDFTYYKPSTVLRRIERRLTINQIETLRDYVSFLESHSGELGTLYRELLIGVTSFFRDREVFDELIERVLPSLFEGAQHDVRLWVAGCSTGEEAYSLAIASREVIDRLARRLEVKVFATDIDRDAIQQASAGVFPDSIAADVPQALLAKYFHPREEHLQVDRSVREMVVFAQHNLIKDPPFTHIDLLSCRNLLIYLQPVLQRKVMELVNFALRPDGVLLLGTSETIGDMGDCFDSLHHKLKIFRSKGKRRPPGEGPEVQSLVDSSRWTANRTRFGGGQYLRQQHEDRMLDRLVQALAGRYVPFSIVVNDQSEVMHVLGDADGFLRFPSGKPMNDLAKLVPKELSIPLSTGLQKVFATGEEIRYSNIRIQRQGRPCNIDVVISSLPAKKGQDPLAVVFLEESNRSGLEPESETQTYDLSAQAEQRIRDLEQELQFTRENLQATIEELETANEELQATNEELLASNEELQSTNEELQSVNEELHTVNAEYQSKIIELTELNNDLDNLLASTRIGTVFLDENLCIRRFTPELRRVIQILDGDIGRPIGHLSHIVDNISLHDLILDVEKSGQSRELEVRTRDGAWFFMRIHPYRVGRTATSGVVVTFIDIGKLKSAQAALVGSEQRFTSLVKTGPMGIGLVIDHTITEASDCLCHLLGFSRETLAGRHESRLYSSLDEYERVIRQLEAQILEKDVGVVETTFLCSDGRRLPVLLSASALDPKSLDHGMTFTVLDMSLRRQALENLRQTEERFRLLFETMEDGVVFQDVSGAIVSANAAAQRILGLSWDALRGRTSADPRWRAIRPDGSSYPTEEHPAMVSLRTGEEVRGVTMGIYNPDSDETRWIVVNAVPMFDAAHARPVEVYTTLHPIARQGASVRPPPAPV